jgi:AraC-like DNA-binding protein
MAKGSTVGTTQVADLLEALRKLGADPASLSASVGLTSSLLRDPSARVPSSRLVNLVELAAQRLGDPLIGLHAGACAETRGPLFYLLLSTPRVSEGMRLFTRFARVPLDTQAMEVEVHEGIVRLTIDPGDPEVEESYNAVDYVVGANLSSLRRAVPDFHLQSVALAHEEMGERGEAAKTFGCPVRFGRRRNALTFSDSILQSVSGAANPIISEQIRRFTSALLDEITATSMRDRAADAIRAIISMGYPPERRAVANRLHVSERTLQRHLEQESTTFSVLRDTVRSELSRALLSNRDLKVEAIARSVGFAEVASFSKAFARWSGCSPTRYREQLKSKHAS